MTRPLAISVFVCLTLATTLATAQTATGNLTLRTGFESQDGPHADLIAQSGSPGAHRFGLRVRSGLTRERFIAGHTVDNGLTLEVAPRAFWHLASNSRTRFGLLTEVGMRQVSSFEDTPSGTRSTALTTRISPTLTRQLAPDTELFAAIHIDTDLALRPGVELDTIAQPMEIGLRRWLTPKLALGASGMVGGAFGYGGDGVKVRWGGTVNLAYTWEERDAASDAASASERARRVIPFLDAGWRGSRIGAHSSHGPEVRFGVMVWKQRLKLGIATINRPGPMNPRTFELALDEGQEYKGKRTLDLRSDGSTVGVLIAPQFQLADSALSIEVPITLGQAGYGFYLTGEDRQTPDERRVSEWENELQESMDAGFSLAADAGIRVKLALGEDGWIQPMLGIHYLITPGYEAFLSSDYGGPSLAAGIQFALF